EGARSLQEGGRASQRSRDRGSLAGEAARSRHPIFEKLRAGARGGEHGRTLVELLAALALSGLLGGAATPSLSGIYGRSRAKGASPELESLEDPVQVGSSHIVSFAPHGQGSSGTFYLCGGRGQLWAIVVYGPTGRVRTFRYDETGEQWTT